MPEDGLDQLSNFDSIYLDAHAHYEISFMMQPIYSVDINNGIMNNGIKYNNDTDYIKKIKNSKKIIIDKYKKYKEDGIISLMLDYQLELFIICQRQLSLFLLPVRVVV